MQETFETNIEQQLSSFSLSPSPQVWQEVDAALHPKRKKRFLIWWWLPVLGLMIGGLGYWIMENETQENKKQVLKVQGNKQQVGKEQESKIQGGNEQVFKQRENIKQQNKEVENKIEENKEQVKNKQDFKVNKEATNTTQNQQVASKKTVAVNDLYNLLEKQQQADFNNQTNEQKAIPAGKTEQLLINKMPNNAIVLDERKSINIAQKEAITKEKEVIITASDSATKNKESITDTAKANKKNDLKLASKKHKWLVVFGGGLLSTPLKNGNNNSTFSNAVSQPSTGVGSGTGTVILDSGFSQASRGFHFEIGLQYQKQVSNKWQFTSGFQYRYLQNSQAVGRDSSGQFFGGTITTKTNYAHWLQVPVIVNYLINPSAKNQWSIVFGGSAAWAFSEQWLVTDNVAKRYYYDASKYNNWLLNLNGELSFNRANRFKLSLLAEYSTTTIHKNLPVYSTTSYNNYHFLQFGLQISKPINFKHKPSTKN